MLNYAILSLETNIGPVQIALPNMEAAMQLQFALTHYVKVGSYVEDNPEPDFPLELTEEEKEATRRVMLLLHLTIAKDDLAIEVNKKANQGASYEAMGSNVRSMCVHRQQLN